MNRLQLRFIRVAMSKLHLLTDWEIEFLQKINSLGSDCTLTEAQNKTLNQIQKKTT